MKKLLKQIRWETMVTSLLYVVLGIVAVAIPETMVRTLGYLAGILLIVAGAVSMICYLLREVSQNYYRNDFGYGLVSIAVGILFLYKIEWISSVIPVILGIMVVASGCGKLQHVIDMKRTGFGNWGAVLVLAAVNLIFGAVLIANPFETVLLLFQLVGVGLIFSGITDCITVYYVGRRLKEYLDKVQAVDASFTEVVDEDRRPEGKHRKGSSSEKENEGAKQ